MLDINLRGKTAFIAGIGDDNGFGWAIAKALAEAGATLILGTWPPVLRIFQTALERGKFDASRRLSDGSLMEFAHIYPLDAAFDSPSSVPEEISSNKRYTGLNGFTIQEVAQQVKEKFGKVDLLVHSLANAPEVKHNLLDTSREGYLAAMSASSYSFLSLLKHFGAIMPAGSSSLCLSYAASEKAVPGYGGGMSSAKAALESDVRTLSWEAGRRWGIRVNAISAGPLRSRAAKAIGMIDAMINYNEANAPLTHPLSAEDVAHAASFLLSPLAQSITGTLLYVDNGMHAMGLAVDSKSLEPVKEEELLKSP